MSNKNQNPMIPNQTGTELLVYATPNGKVKVEILLKDESIWLTQDRIAELFGVQRPAVSKHLKNIFESGELQEEVVSSILEHTTQHGAIEGKTQTKAVKVYNLDSIISVGYRVNSKQATLFRIWATERLREYIVKGFTMDDERLKKSGGGSYFDELLARIRDIRSSEKVFWRKVLDIYATSIDYDPKSDVSREFFKIIQNKMHWAAHGQTAAEVIYRRVDATQPNLGMTNWTGSRISKSEAEVAKNYLNPEELDLLNRIVTLYLDFAELQAIQRKAMHMRDWISKLDDFLKLSDRDILTHAGKISHDAALRKAHEEYEKFRLQQIKEPTEAEKHFVEAEAELKQIETTHKKSRRS